MRQEAFGDQSLTVESCDNREREMRDWLQAKIDSEDRKLSRLGEKIIRAMTEYKEEWKLETREVDVNIAAGYEYRSMFAQLQADDLPRFEDRFKELLNVSLTQIDYNPGRYITLEVQISPDADIRDFQSELRACTEGTLTGSDDAQYSEAKFLQVWRSINHRILGANELPDEIWIDALDEALGWIGKRQEARQFAAMVTLTRDWQPALLPWLAKRPLRALELAEEWPRILTIVAWRLKHPRPGIYLRQIDLPGVHSKFIETHRSVLGELFDLVLPPEEIDATATGAIGFCRRYGFQDKPLRVRFRILDPALALLPTESDQDITVTQETFARLKIPVTTVFITENEINFLAFPEVPEAMVIFGAGYGFENLASVEWMRNRVIHYWGDIDTHGFAILNQLRGFFPDVTSLLMDSETLIEHQTLWGVEPSPETGALTRLTSEESALYGQLGRNELGHHIRLEQEKIGFEWLVDALGRV